MKKVLWSALIISIVLFTKKANAQVVSLENPGSESIVSSIREVENPTFNVTLSWGEFTYDYIYRNDNNSSGNMRIWNGNPTVNVKNNSNINVSVSFNWVPEISEIGVLLMHMNAQCSKVTDQEILNLIQTGNKEFYSDSSCTEISNDINLENKYYYETTNVSWYDSLTSGATYYSNYVNMNSSGVGIGFPSDVEGTANGLLNNKEFIIRNDSKLISNTGEVIWAPMFASDYGSGVDFNVSLADTIQSRDLNTLNEGDSIGTLTVTIDGIE